MMYKAVKVLLFSLFGDVAVDGVVREDLVFPNSGRDDPLTQGDKINTRVTFYVL